MQRFLRKLRIWWRTHAYTTTRFDKRFLFKFDIYAWHPSGGKIYRCLDIIARTVDDAIEMALTEGVGPKGQWPDYVLVEKPAEMVEIGLGVPVIPLDALQRRACWSSDRITKYALGIGDGQLSQETE